MTLKLDPARSQLIGGFVDAYLTLTASEMQQYEAELGTLTEEEKTATMELMTSWERAGVEKGLMQGLHDGKVSLLMRQVVRRFGSVSSDIEARVNGLTNEQIDRLSEDFLDFRDASDLERWLA